MPDTDRLTSDFARKHPDAFAKVLNRGETSEIFEIVLQLPTDAVAAVVSRLSKGCIDGVLKNERCPVQDWLVDAPLADAVKLLGRIPREQSLALVNSLPHRERRHRLLRYLRYPSHSVGALVSDVTVRIAADTPAADVLAELRGLQPDSESSLAVLHPDGRYLGVLDPWALLMEETLAGPIRDYVKNVPVQSPETSQINAKEDPAWLDHSWLPVVDHEARLLGSIARRDLFAAAEKQIAAAAQETDVFATLISELAYSMARILERVLIRRRVS
ncbi:MAG: hypothetical protein R3288_02130 [Woeseiaceae bacterium]|nr:hypothetical protein [Woeseiaceae bacterium]